MNCSGKRPSVSNWGYVAIAYIAVWGALALYALTLAQRVTQARRVAQAMREATSSAPTRAESESVACDTPPAS
jgi:hypothetical protein